ncbi:hypothetical protein LX77_02406 [Gelidibacter algens]|uniref:Uncharacterized protein n=1 Tax=Gelidibacter algens TaxID=49280 RepID=A0A327S0T7_9FLAO|nr:hypothetical protein LX77_02406 [Gelidibacter algens]
MTPGTQPQSHNKNTIIIEPQPLSITAKGGQKIERITLQIPMILMILMIDVFVRREIMEFVTVDFRK